MAKKNLDAVDVEIKVAGKHCDFTTMELYQSVCRHHRFRITVNYKPDKPSVWAVGPDEIFKQLGEKVSIVMTHVASGEITEFYGLISDIKAGGLDGNQGHVILEGGSPTILLDRDPGMDCYVEQNLTTIVSDVIDKSGVPLSLTNSPKYNGIIPYVARYKETGYAFLSRLLRSHGEWFYYDGQKLLVGDPKIMKETRVAYDIDLTEVTIDASIRALNTSVFDFDPVENIFHYDYSGTPEGVTLGSKAAEDCSKPFFPTETTLPAVKPIHSGIDIENYGNAGFHREYSRLSQFSAKSRNSAIRLGELIVARVPRTLPGVTLVDLGRYRVTEITHVVNGEGRYSNTFSGVPGSTPTMPWGDAVMPVAYPEMARVTDHQDPKNLGRVKVQFMWQEMNKGESYWMRVQSPDAGKSDNVAQNRGMLFIPEIGDLVMVGYEQGNPDRPFVMGSVFYKENSGGVTGENTVKSIRTRSGHTLEFNDDEEGEWGITIKDREGNVMRMDTKGKNIEITAPESMTLNAKNIELNAQEDISITADGKLDVNIAKEGELKFDKAKVDVNNSLEVLSKEYQNESDEIAVISKGKLTLDGKKTTKLSGKKVEIQGSSNKLELP